jgi:hypothetical protein
VMYVVYFRVGRDVRSLYAQTVTVIEPNSQGNRADQGA